MELTPSRHPVRPFPKFTRPKIEGYFSVDSQRYYKSSLCNLKYLKVPANINFSLNDGDETYVEKPASAGDEQISHLLTFIKNNRSVMLGRDTPDFVCFRGLLRMLMSTPYDDREPWIILATKFKGTIYLCAEETAVKKAAKRRQTDKDKMFSRYGFKFESYVLSEHPDKPPPGNSKPVIEAEEFCLMFNTVLDGKNILYGAEIDGVIARDTCKSLSDLQKTRLVEVKVKRRETSEKQLQNFIRFKSRNWWLQSFLVGIDSIHVGVRNDNGIVEEVNRMSLKEISDEAKANNFWHGTVCMNFLNDFLKKVASDMKATDDPLIVFRYQWDQSRTSFVTCKTVVGRMHSFLPPDYINFITDITRKPD